MLSKEKFDQLDTQAKLDYLFDLSQGSPKPSEATKPSGQSTSNPATSGTSTNKPSGVTSQHTPEKAKLEADNEVGGHPSTEKPVDGTQKPKPGEPGTPSNPAKKGETK